jgi:hypothetical protein
MANQTTYNKWELERNAKMEVARRETLFLAFGLGCLKMYEIIDNWQEEVEGYKQYNNYYGGWSFVIKENELLDIQAELKQMGFVHWKKAMRKITYKKPVKGQKYKLQSTILNDSELTHYVIHTRKPFNNEQ